MIDNEKAKEKLAAFKMNKDLYDYVVKGDEKNKSIEFRRCVYVSFIFKEMFDKLAKLDTKLFLQLHDSLDRYSQWELSKFVRRFEG
jgi:hypothetical protein